LFLGFNPVVTVARKRWRRRIEEISIIASSTNETAVFGVNEKKRQKK
jgi:hypothetical protein